MPTPLCSSILIFPPSCRLQERQALELMRQEFENELQAARSEVAKAQEALAGSEERIRATEQVRMKLTMEHLCQILQEMRSAFGPQSR